MFRLKEALEERGLTVWIDADDIPPGALWRRELGTAIEAADCFVFVISPDSAASRVCAEELARATELGKRMIPVRFRRTAAVPEPLAGAQYIDAEDGAEFDRTVDQLERAIETDHDWVRAHTQWLARALRWNERRRDRSLLLRGSELAAAEQWLARQPEGKKPPPTPLQTEYIVAGRNAEKRRLRTIVGWTLAALATSLALAVYALISRNEAIEQRDQARSRELATTAITQLDVDPERSLLLALEAEDIAASDAADDALRRALAESHVRAVMRGHTDSVSRAAVSRDGRRVVTTSRDGTARVFDAASGRPLAVLEGHRGPLETPALTSDGRRVLTASDDGTARIWDATGGQPLATLRHGPGVVNSGAFSADGRRAVTSGEDGTARIWDAASGRQLAVLRGHDGEVRAAAFDRTGARVLTAGVDGTARLWSVATGRGKVLVRHGSIVHAAEFSRDGRRVLTAEDAGTVRVSSVPGGDTVTELPGMAFNATFSPDASAIVTTTIDGPAVLWDAATGERRAELEGHGGPVLAAAFSPDGHLFVTAGLDGTARIWDAQTGTAVAVLRGHTATVNRAIFTPDGQSVVTVSGDRTARRWDVGTGTVLRGHSTGTDSVPPSVNAVAGGPDGRTVLTAADDGTARLWDARTGRELTGGRACGLPESFSCLSRAVLFGHASFIHAADLSPDGRLVATGGDRGSAFVFEAATGEEVAALRGHRGRVLAASFSPDGRRVVTAADDGTARVWETRTGEPVAVLRGHVAVPDDTVPSGESKTVNAAVFMPGGHRVATAGTDGTVRLWDVDAERELRTLRARSGAVVDVAVSPDGRYVAAPDDETARIWDAATGRTVAALTDHDGLVFSVGFSPDGRALVTGGQDMTARIWEVPSGRPLAVLRGHSAYLIATAFSRDGRSVLTAADDATARVYPCDACGSHDELVVRARDRLTRPLSADERRRFLE